MRLTDRFDGSAAPFEGDRTLEIRSLPANAKVSKATITLTPLAARGGGLFEETIIPGGDARVSRGATKFSGTGFVEVDFHQRRTLRAVQGSNLSGANLQVEMGGIYVQLNKAGAIKAASDQEEFPVPADGRLPGLTVSKFKLSRDPSLPFVAFDLTAVTVSSVPLNVTARIGDLPPFFARVGEMSQEQVSADFAASVQAFLAEAPVANGFYVVPLVLHSDSIARISVALAIEYVVESPVLKAGVGEPVLPFDLSGQATTENKLLTIEVPAHSRIARRGIQGRVTGTFDDMRVLHPPELPLMPIEQDGRTVSIGNDSSFAQPIKLGGPVVATAIDLLLAVRSPGALQLDLHDDLDGKPGSTSLLPAPMRFEPPAPTGGKLSGEADFLAKWLTVPLPAEFKFSETERYWLVLQSLDGEADWRVEPASPESDSERGPGLQATQDGALSWREAVSPEAGNRFGGLFRLRGRTTPYRMPIEMRVGPPDPANGKQPQRVTLERFAPSGRVDFTLDFEELSKAANDYLDSAATASPATGEHLVNGNFKQWLTIGQRPNDPVEIDLSPFAPVALAVAPNGARAYLAGTRGAETFSIGVSTTTEGMLIAVDLVCGRLEKETVNLREALPRSLVLSPDGSRAYIGSGDRLLVVDLTTGTLAADSPEIPGIFALASSPDGASLYATTLSGGSSDLAVIDTAVLEDFFLSGHQADLKFTTATVPLDFKSGAFVGVSPNGAHLYLAGGNELRVLDFTSPTAAGSPVILGGDATGIAITPDGLRALVPTTNPAGVALVDLVQRTVTRLPLSADPVSVAITPDAKRGYVATDDGTISVIDIEAARLEPESISVAREPRMLAISPQGDRIVVANAVNRLLTLIQLGVPWPHEWNILTGDVSRLCLADDPVLVLGSLRQHDDHDDAAPASAPAAISQVVPVVGSGHYEISFQAFATTPEAFAEVVFRGENCEAFPAERVPIQTLMHGSSAFTAAHRDSRSLLMAHRKQLIAPKGARQAEVRFIAGQGMVAAIANASFTGASERLANTDFSQREENGLAAWTLSPGGSTGVTLLAAAEGIRVQNAGAHPVELVQKVSAEASQFFTLEFEGSVVRSSARAAPQIELRWLGDGAPAEEPATLEISAYGLALAAAHGRSPKATGAEIRLAVPSGVTLEVKRVSLRFTEAIPLTLSFMAETVGEIAITDLRVAFEDVPPTPPSLPPDGLCEASSAPDAPCGKACDGETSFCPCCQREEPLVQARRMETEAGRPVLVGQCRTCGTEVPRFGGRSEPGAAPFELRRNSMARPLVLTARVSRPLPISLQRKAQINPVEALTEIGLIGPKRAERLVTSGIDTPTRLAATSAQEIVKLLKPGISLEQAEQMRIEAAEFNS